MQQPTLVIASQSWSRLDPVLACIIVVNPTKTSYEAKTVAVMGVLISEYTRTKPNTKKNVLMVRGSEASLTTRQFVVPRGQWLNTGEILAQIQCVIRNKEPPTSNQTVHSE
jgi:hypothetical protein